MFVIIGVRCQFVGAVDRHAMTNAVIPNDRQRRERDGTSSSVATPGDVAGDDPAAVMTPAGDGRTLFIAIHDHVNAKSTAQAIISTIVMLPSSTIVNAVEPRLTRHWCVAARYCLEHGSASCSVATDHVEDAQILPGRRDQAASSDAARLPNRDRQREPRRHWLTAVHHIGLDRPTDRAVWWVPVRAAPRPAGG